jgi:ribosomal protein S18 acetylase RimI-like enzyme
MRQDRGVVKLDELIGRRVALRHRVPGPDERELCTDAVGELAGAEGPTDVLVHTRHGVVTVDRASVVAVREIPPAQPRRPSWASVARLENICADAWPPSVTRRLGQWRLRAEGELTARANSALVVGDPGVAVPQALAEVRRFAAEHGLAPRLQVPTGSPWHRTVSEHGWTPDTEHQEGSRVLVMVGAVARLASPVAQAGVRLTVRDEPDQDWWRIAGDPPVTEGQRGVPRAADLPEVGFGLARIGDRAVGGMRLVALDEHLHLARLAVLPQYRRRGLAVALLDAAARWALPRGARWCVLQVAQQNDAAIGLYRRLGFQPHHECEYLRPEEPA